MKVKHVFLIAAVLLALLAMSPVAAEESGMEPETDNAELTYGIDSSYTVDIPETISFTAGAVVSVSDVCIDDGAALVVNVTSQNGWILKLNENDILNYKMFIGDKSTPAVNDDLVINIAYPATADSVQLKFTTDETAKKSGNYKDTLTFTTMMVANGAGEADSQILLISNLTELKNFREAVNSGNSYQGWTVKLVDNIDLITETTWNPIGGGSNAFKGVFDGQDHTISNLTVSMGGEAAGLFGYITSPAIIKNVNIKNAEVSGSALVGALVGNAYTGQIVNCHVSGDITISGNYKVGGLVGGQYVSITGCSVIGNTDSSSSVTGRYKKADLEGDNVGGLIGFKAEGSSNIKDCTVKSLTVTGTRKVGGIAGSASGNTNIVNCIVNSVTIGTNANSEYATTNEKSMGIGGLVGLYNQADSTYSGGTLSGTVSDVTLRNENSVSASMGYVTGGQRGTDNGPVDPTSILGSTSVTLTGTNTGANVTFCEPASQN